MRSLPPILLALLLCGCHSKPVELPPAPIRTGIKVPSITIEANSGWAAAPVIRGTPLFTNDDFSIQFYPPAMQGAILIQRPESVAANGGYLEGKVTVPAPATLYVAILYQVNDNRLVTDAQLSAFAGDGWTRTPGIFSTSQPEGAAWWWRVYSHPIPAGPVTLASKELANPGVFIIGKLR